MTDQIRNSLSSMDCALALKLSEQLFQSKYSDNEIRMLHASAHACNAGIQLYPLIDEVSTSDFSTFNATMKTFVRLFPSRTLLDSKLESTWYSQDILQSILKPGTVIGASDQNIINGFNTGSLLFRDRTDDANTFLIFTSMAGVGASLNRHGYSSIQDPVVLGYAQGQALTWTTMATIKNDISHAGCSLASSLLNMYDGISAILPITSGPLGTALSLISVNQSAVEAAANVECLANAFSATQCDLAKKRIRFRDACFEKDEVAAYAAGVIKIIDAGW